LNGDHNEAAIIASVAAVAVIAAGGVLIGRLLWTGRCSASFEEVQAADLAKLHAVPVGPQCRPDLQSDDMLNGPVSTARSARSSLVFSADQPGNP
jgi:hypothetical protein